MPDFEVFGRKRPKWFDPDEEAQRSQIIIAVDSLERTSDAQPALAGAPQDDSKEACASLEDGTPAGGLPNVDVTMGETPL